MFHELRLRLIEQKIVFAKCLSKGQTVSALSNPPFQSQLKIKSLIVPVFIQFTYSYCLN